MAKMPWLKLYTEIRTDPKMQALNDSEFRTWVNLMCLSAESKVRGVICIEEGIAHPIEGLAKTLYLSPEELTACLEKFRKLRMIDIEDGIIALIHFDDRQQGKLSDDPGEVAKRVRKYRDKKKRDGNANVTPSKREGNAIEEDKDKELDNNIIIPAGEENESIVPEAEVSLPEAESIVPDSEEFVLKTEEGRPMDIGTRAVDWADKNWARMLSPIEIDEILAWCDEFSSRGSPDPDGVVIEALNKCDAAGPDKRNRNYLSGILTRWRDAGILTVDHIQKREDEHKIKKDHKPGNKGRGDKESKPPPETGKYDNFYL